MDSTGDAEPADELADLARQLRAQLARHLALGAWAAPGGPTAAYAGRAEVADAAPVEEAAPAVEEADAAPAAPVAAPAPSAPAPAAPVAAPAPAAPVVAPAPVATPADDDRDADGIPHAAFALDAGPVAFGDDADFAAGFFAASEPRDARAPSAPRPPSAPRAPVPAAAPAPAPELISLGRRTLAQIREDLGDCTRCKLHSTRKNIVFGVGAEDAPLMFIGEAPGEQEDKRGEPFVGPAGDLLTRMIEAMGWTRQTVYIANTTKCRPPNNRNPQPDELAQCTPFLDAQIRSIAPRIIVTLGRPAANHVLHKDAPISSLRGRFHDRAGVKVMPTFHPAYLLRDPDKKKDTWSDLKQVIAELERLGIKPPNPPRG
jgi:DNA polymerase